MIFIDEARIFVKGGDGGQGCESFYREKHMRHPRPDGGDGGRGGNVVIAADKSIQTLLDYKYKQHFKGDKGGNASSKRKQGRNGRDCILRVPQGTIVKDADNDLMIKDLVDDAQSVIVAKGGSGGQGNAKKKEPTYPEKGEERTVHLELKLIADVGIIGFPNAGKSTLISGLSKVQSKVANYPFTTKKPILGFVDDEEHPFIVADLPGIIEGAHKGKGLGDRFLKHAERTKILIHLIDMAATEGRKPAEDYEKIHFELQQYSDILTFKHKIIVANKMDVDGANEHLDQFKGKIKEPVIPISALQKRGFEELIEKIKGILCQESSLEK